MEIEGNDHEMLPESGKENLVVCETGEAQR